MGRDQYKTLLYNFYPSQAWCCTAVTEVLRMLRQVNHPKPAKVPFCLSQTEGKKERKKEILFLYMLWYV